MLFRFHFGRSSEGGWGVSRPLACYMPYWRAVDVADDRLVYRPSERTLIHHLGISLMAGFVLAVALWYSGLPKNPFEPVSPNDDVKAAAIDDETRQELERFTNELRQQLPVETQRELELRQEQRSRKRAAQLATSRKWRGRFTVAGRLLHGIFFYWLIGVGVVPLLTFPRKQVTIQRTRDNELVVRRRGLWTSEHRWPLESFGQIVYGAKEETSRYRTMRISLGWRWTVKLTTAPGFTDSGPSSRLTGGYFGLYVEFYIDHQKQRPVDPADPPAAVKSFVKHLRRLTGVDEIMHTEIDDAPGMFGFVRRRTYRSTLSQVSEPVARRQVYNSLDEVPEHLRGQVEELKRKAAASDEKTATQRSVRITIRDSSGNEETYTSLDDMPPDVRRRYEKARRSKRKKRRRNS